MLRWALTIAMGCGLISTSVAQLKKFYSLSEVSQFDTVNFEFEATSGHTHWRQVASGNPLTIYGNPDLDKINPTFDAQILQRNCQVSLGLEEFRNSGLGDGLAFAMLGSSPTEYDDNYWKVLLSDEKVYNLNMHYGIGTSDINLSGAKVKKLEIRTGSAEVSVSYSADKPNLCEMDTFMVKVDMGSFTANDLDHARAKFVSAEIGFGKAILDFSHPVTNSCEVQCNVGLGKLRVLLPKEAPVIIYLKDSPFRALRMMKDFEEVEKNVFINRTYDAEADNLLTFKVDVSLGNVDFRYAD